MDLTSNTENLETAPPQERIRSWGKTKEKALGTLTSYKGSGRRARPGGYFQEARKAGGKLVLGPVGGMGLATEMVLLVLP